MMMVDPRISRLLNSLSHLKIVDLEALLAVHRLGSLSAAAREISVTPSQISKAITRLETLLAMRLITRTARGVEIAPAAQPLLPRFAEWLQQLEQIGQELSPQSQTRTIAAPSYLCSRLVTRLIGETPEIHWRTLALSPALIRAYVAENVYDLALAVDEHRLPSSWVSTLVGDMHHALFARADLAKGLGTRAVSIDKVRALTFIAPVRLVEGRLVPGEDSCPLPRGERRLGHQVETIDVALELAVRTEQVVFAPLIAAQRWVESGTLAEIRVVGWNVATPLYLWCNSNRTRAKELKMVLSHLTAALR